MTTNQLAATFDTAASIAMREHGMAMATAPRLTVLEVARRAARAAAKSRSYERWATIDDAYLGIIAAGHDPAELGPAAGSVFRGSEWTATGRWLPSTRVSNHARMVRVWRWVGSC